MGKFKQMFIMQDEFEEFLNKQRPQYDEWDACLIRIENLYGKELADKLSTLIDEGKIEEANTIMKYI